MTTKLDDIEQRIADAIRRQMEWEGQSIHPDKLDRLAKNVRDSLGLAEFSATYPVAERWWSTEIQTQDDEGEWQWLA
ncbi:hypothetical protein [Mycolicibacterium septicum]|uniref:hypothetical protein n=1 Tax=Mycolicibacterium septicum TaxID=98668 RepID=UPI001AF6D631|nr:hypothetical protein [Mycolicibacterium septicum]QRY51702.1 hypothetical protein JVX95_30725 [Mycolicibacterium septicum]